MTTWLANFWLCALLVCLFSADGGYALDTTNTDVNLVSFFKQVINSPPEIENYVAKRTNLQMPTALMKAIPPVFSNSSSYDLTAYLYYEGALSGTNFFLHTLFDPERPFDSNHLGVISARAGPSIYQIGGHGVVRGIGKNGLAESVQAQFGVSRQILCMGAGEIAAGSVK